MCPHALRCCPGNLLTSHAPSLPRPRISAGRLEATLAAAALALPARDLLPLTVRRERSRAIHRLAFAYFGETEGDLSPGSGLQQRRLPRRRGARPGPPGRLSAALALHEAADDPVSGACHPRRQPYVGRPCALACLGCGPAMKRRGGGCGARRAMPAAGGAFALRVLAPGAEASGRLASLAGSMKTGLGNRRPRRLAALSATPGGGRPPTTAAARRRAPKVARCALA